MTSSTWSRDFISKRFLVRTLHIRHLIKVLMPSIFLFQGLTLIQVSTPSFPPLNHVCLRSWKWEGITHDSNFKVMKKRLKSRIKLIFKRYYSFHWKITWSYRFFSCKVSCFLFPNWILQIIRKSSFYLLREWPKTYNKFYFFCVYHTNNTFQKQSLETYLQIYILSF